MRQLPFVLLCCAFAIPAQAQNGPSLQAGAAVELITPPPGSSMAGYYFARAAEGVHDDLYAKAIVIKQGDVKAALVSWILSAPRTQWWKIVAKKSKN